MPLEGEGFLPVPASQTFTVPSSLAEASRLPSGLNATLMTSPVCPLRVRVSCPVPASHTFTVLSSLAEASRLPSGLNATLVTAVRVPLEGEGFLPGPGVPHLHRPVVAGGGEPFAVGAERHARDSPQCAP